MKEKNVIIDLKKEYVHYPDESPIHVALKSIEHSSVHFHESDIEILYCLNGQANIICNHELCTLSEGEIFTIGHRDIHCIYSNAPNCLIVFHINMKKLSVPFDFLEFVYLECQDYPCKQQKLPALHKIKDMVLSASYLYMMNEYVSIKCNEMANGIIDVMLNNFDWYDPSNTYPYTNEELRERMHNIIRYCQENYKTKLTIASLSDDMYINKNYFSQFMHNSGYGSFSNMLGYIRSFEAQHLLLTPDLSILDISHMCGFSDDKYFYKHFKLWWNKTPQEYRNWFKEYTKTKDSIYTFTESEGHDILTNHIIKHFIENTFHFDL